MDEKNTKNSLIVLSVALGIFAAAFIGFLIYYLVSQPAAQSVQSILDAAQQKLINDLITKQDADLESLTKSINLINKQIKEEDVLNKLNNLIKSVSALSEKQAKDNTTRASEISELSAIQASENTRRALEISGLGTSLELESTARSDAISALSTLQASNNTARASEISALATLQASDNTARASSISSLSGTVSFLSVKQETDNTNIVNAMTGLSGTVSLLSVKQATDNTNRVNANADRVGEIGALTQSLTKLNDPQKGEIASILLSISNLTKTQLDDIGIINKKFAEIRDVIDSNQTSLRNSLSTNEIRITAKDGSVWKVIIDNNGKLCFNHLDYLVCLDDIQNNMDQIVAQKQKTKIN